MVCPLTLIEGDDWLAIELAGLFRKGLPPVAGGALDQTSQFLDAANFIWSEQARCKAAFASRFEMPEP